MIAKLQLLKCLIFQLVDIEQCCPTYNKQDSVCPVLSCPVPGSPALPMPIVETFSDLESLPADADAVFDAAADAGGVFLTKAWFGNLAACGLGRESGLRIYGVRDRAGAALSLLLPLRLTTNVIVALVPPGLPSVAIPGGID